jgi:predicted  nucleic acid-binding Zn-ribbon protein
LVQEKISLQLQNIDEHKKHNEREVSDKQSEIANNNVQIITLQKDIDLIQTHVDVLQKEISDKETVSAKKES